jgi:hypothetical protein
MLENAAVKKNAWRNHIFKVVQISKSSLRKPMQNQVVKTYHL